MTITLEIRPEIQAELARQAAASGRALEVHAAELLETAARVSLKEQLPAIGEPSFTMPRSGQLLVDAFAEIRGILTDEEIDRMFSRNASSARPVDFS